MIETFQQYFPKIIPKNIKSLFIILIPFINLFQCNSQSLLTPSFLNQDTSFNYLNSKLIKNKTDIFLISTKDGYLHAISRDQKELWKTYLESELISSPASIIKISDDLILYPVNERLYINRNGKFYPFPFFVNNG